MKTFYHVTKKENLLSILKKGLLPTIGDRSKKLNEQPAIFLFKSIDELDTALMNWLGDEFDDNEELITLKIDIDEKDLIYNEFEVISFNKINPNKISFFRDE